jgi:hypothetical protein
MFLRTHVLGNDMHIAIGSSDDVVSVRRYQLGVGHCLWEVPGDWEQASTPVINYNSGICWRPNRVSKTLRRIARIED